MTTRSMRSSRRTAGLVIAFAMALSIPGVGEANHNTCTQQGSSDPNAQQADFCPEFSPGFVAHVKYPYRNSPAAINLEVSQARGESNLLLWEWFLPREWQFNLNIREALAADGTAPVKPPLGTSPALDAAGCDQLFNPSNNAPNAEAVSDGNAIWTQQGSAAIEKWTSKRGMFYWYTEDYRTTLCTRFVSGGKVWTTPVYLDRVDSFGDMSPYGWKVTVPVETIQATTWWTGAIGSGNDYSLVTVDLEFKQKTSGTWHNLDDVNGDFTPVVFSQAPANPVQTRIGTRAWACTNGLDTVAACKAPANQSKGSLISYPTPSNTATEYKLAEFPFTVNSAPVTSGQPFARFNKVGDVTIPGTGTRFDRPVDGFGYQEGNNLTLNWNTVTGTASNVQVVGYALAAHKIVEHQQPTTEAELEAGRVMFARTMLPAASLSHTFNLAQMPENVSLGTLDGKYDSSVVTIYNLTHNNVTYEGYRSDGLCDGVLTGQQVKIDGQFAADDGRGVLCPADGRPVWATANPQNLQGIGDWQTIVRQDAWPLRYYYSQLNQPFQILLVDPAKQIAELTVWGSVGYGTNSTIGNNPPCNPPGSTGTCNDPQPSTFRYMGQGRADQGASKVYRAGTGILQAPSGQTPGYVHFGTADLEGESHNWWFTGRIGGQTLPGLSATSGAAYGVFEQYAPRGSDLDWFRPTNPGNPQGWVTSITQQRGDNARMYPDTITNDFIGTSF